MTYFYRPGMITYARYTSVNPIWPIHSEAWLDLDHDRFRSWDVQTTDQWDSPYVCTAMYVDGQYYPCLPSTETQAASQPPSLTPNGPMGEGEKSSGDLEGMPVTKLRWDVSDSKEYQSLSSDASQYCDNEATARMYYELDINSDGIPVADVTGADCNGTDRPIVGTVYHSFEFVSPGSLPPDFFDPDKTAEQLASPYFQPVQKRFGIAYWLGLQSNGYFLKGAEPCHGVPGCFELVYVPAEYREVPEGESSRPNLVLSSGYPNSTCKNEEPITGLPSGKLCSREGDSPGTHMYYAEWALPDGNIASLLADSPFSEGTPTHDEFVALLSNVRPYDGPAAQEAPFLTKEEVRQFVGDYLELVCWSQRAAIQSARQTANFEYDTAKGEWTGSFGAFGNFTVNDLKPVVVPQGVNDSNASTFPVEQADCVKNEPTPTPTPTPTSAWSSGTSP